MIDLIQETRAAARPCKMRLTFQLPRIAGTLIAALLLALSPARGEEVEDQYFKILATIQQADSLSANGQTDKALEKYRQAGAALQKFQKASPEWNASVV